MNERPVEPLSPEERALAERLARLGPHDGPSPALDARILAAAHKAAAGSPKKARRRLWLGLPPALLTGLGSAAAAVLVLAVAWQMRPPSMPKVAREADAGSELVMVDATPARVRPLRAPAPPAEAAAEAAAPVVPAPAPAAEARTASAAEADTASAVAAQAAAPVPMAAAPAAPEPPRRERALEPPPAPMPLADTAGEAAADAALAAESTAAPAAPAAAPARPSYTTAARATARLPQARQPAAKASTEAAAPAEAEAIDRIEITGSRVAPTADDLRRIPLRQDRALAPEAWLERIRARRDAGLDAQARESLRQFRRRHPEVEIPSDLQPLLR